MKDNFEALKEYFSKLDEDKIVYWEDNGNFRIPYLDISWLSTNDLSSETIEKAIINIMNRANRNANVTHIDGLRVCINDYRLKLQASIKNKYSKLNITNHIVESDNNSKGKIPTITLDELANEVLEVLDQQEIDEKIEIVKDIFWKKSQPDEEIIQLIREKYKKDLSNNPNRLENIKEKLNDIWGNLIKYYDYLIDEKQENMPKCIIEQRTDKNTKHGTYREYNGERKNPIVAFLERKKLLESKNPVMSISVDEIKKDGTYMKNSYATYIFKGLLENIGQKQDGYLFVCEPLEGNRHTRLVYLTEEEFENFPTEENENKFEKIVEKYLCMSKGEFSREKGTYSLAHGDFKSFTERLNFLLNGERLDNNITYYINVLKNLYKNPDINPPYYKPRKRRTVSDIAKMSEGIPESAIDRTAQYVVENTKEERNEE